MNIRVLRGENPLVLDTGTEGNGYYLGNRFPLARSAFYKLPIGSIKPKGWLLRYLELMRDGLTGRLPELSEWCRAEGNAWLSPTGEGHSGWEELPYWLKGFADLGYILNDSQILAETKRWIDGVLSSQREDGYFGPRENLTRLDGKPDMWPNMIMLGALRSCYEARGDPRIIPFIQKYFAWQFSVPEDDFLVPFWQKMRAGDNLLSVYWLYNHTGEPSLLDLATKIHEHTADWTSGIASWHGVNIAQCFREPACYYIQTRDLDFVEATVRNYETVMGEYGQVPGGMFGADENCRKGYIDPRQASETCSMVEFMHSFELLIRITGHPVWADRCEEVLFNSFPASMTPDLKALHYLTAPNMVQLDRGDKSPFLQNKGCMLAYDPWRYRCCQHNVSHGLPYYAEELWLATPGDGICASLYAPSEVSAKVGDGTTIRISEETDYPFGESIRFRISTPSEVFFPFFLRIPVWCDEPRLTLNGQNIPCELEPLSYVGIERTWSDGDELVFELPMRISLKIWRKNKGSVSISRGPLTYSLLIQERWVRSGGTEEWPAFEVFPASAWNYALEVDLNNSFGGSFEVIKRGSEVPLEAFTPDSTPIKIRAKGRRLPVWKQEENGLVGEVPESPVQSSEPLEDITLIPMGCARLRISAFPRLG